MKPYFVNNVDVSMADIVTISFAFAINAEAQKEYVAHVSMHMGMLQALYETIGKTLEQHKAHMSNHNTNKALS